MNAKEQKTLQALALARLTEAAREVAESFEAGDLDASMIENLLAAVNSEHVFQIARKMKSESDL